MRNNKILHILYSGFGGVGTMIWDIIKADTEHCFSNELIFIGIEPLYPEYRKNSESLGIPFHFIHKKKGFDLHSICLLNKYVLRSSAATIIIHGLNLAAYVRPSTLWQKWKQVIIYQHHAYDLLKANEIWILHRAHLFAQKIVFLTSGYVDDFRKEHENPSRYIKSYVLPNPLDFGTFYQAPKMHIRPVPEVGMHGRFVPGKKFYLLIEAAALLKEKGEDIVFRLAGTGSDWENIQQKIAADHLHETVILQGQLNKAEIVSYLQSLDIYALMTLREGHSLAAIEAGAAGLPVIASDVPALNELICNGETGLLIPNDAAALAEALILLKKDDSLRLGLARSFQEKIKHTHSLHTYFSQYKDLIVAP